MVRFHWKRFRSERILLLLLIALLPAAGCSRLTPYRATSAPSTMLSQWFKPKPTPVGSDSYANHLNASRDLLAASNAATRADAGGRKVIRSTAAPEGAYLPTAPIEVAVAGKQPAPEVEWLEELPPPNRNEVVASPPPVAAPVAATVIESPAPAAVAVAPVAVSEPPTRVIPDGDAQRIHGILAEARRTLDATRSYRVRMQRQERVGQRLQPEEEVILSVRREPSSVRLEWPSGPSQGREVIYNAPAEGIGPMHIRMPNNLVMPRMTLAADSPLALQNSRHPITEAGLDTILARLETSEQRMASAATGAAPIRYEGLITPEPEAAPCHKLVQTLPSGETWEVLIATDTKLPYLVKASDQGGELLERYVFRDLQRDPAELSAANAFDPDARWGQSRGLLGRLARAAEGDPAGGDATPVR